jgi:hypothetical protein
MTKELPPPAARQGASCCAAASIAPWRRPSRRYIPRGRLGGGAVMRLVRQFDVVAMGAALALIGAIVCGIL